MGTENAQGKNDLIKLAIMGGGGTGKSNLTMRIINGVFTDHYDPTLEDAYTKENYLVDGKTVDLEITDTAGQDTFIGIRDQYYRNCDGFVFVYSIADRGSLADVEERHSSLQRVKEAEDKGMPPIVVVGNKCDLENERSVSPEEGQDLTKSLGDTAVFIEASAKTNLNVEEVFQQAAKAVIQQRLQDSQKNGKKPRGKCCTII